MTSVDDWLSHQIQPPQRLALPILVLCRTSATLNTVRAWAAFQRGRAGFEVATPRMLAAQLEGPRLSPRPPTTEELPEHPFADRIRSRPGLVALARQRVIETRRSLQADPDLSVPPWLSELCATDWAREKNAELDLLALAQANGPRLTASLAWSRVIPIGFNLPLDPYTRALVEALIRTPASPDVPPPSSRPQRAVFVPDPVAEARQAARLANPSPHDTLILVQHPATAARVQRALLRNGVPSAWRGSVRLQRHTLATVIRRCVPWFAGEPDPNLRATDLHDVLRHPLLAQRLPPPAEAWLRGRLEQLGENPDHTWIPPQELTRAIRRARHLDAPLSRWMEEVDALQYKSDEAGTPARSARLYARLGVLLATVRGIPFHDLFPNDAPEEDEGWGDYDALVSRLIGGQDPTTPPPLARPGTLGALRRFLLACRVRTKDDPAALRILGALRDGAHRPATRLEALQCLVGSVERAECRRGVEILTYDDYDGRPSQTLILCDVHDQGLAARPHPDPLLSAAQITALGQLGPRERVQLRLQQLQRAVSRAHSSTALVCEHDPMGRPVNPPVQLHLQPEPASSSPYGLNAELPEIEATRALKVTTPQPGPPPDSPLGRLSIQATAEWYRAGRGPIGAPPLRSSVPGSDTLAHLLVQRPTPPDWLAPLLGSCVDVPEARLADEERSVSRFFTPLSHCLYQAFARNILHLDEPESLSEELDAREVGRAVHLALEKAASAGGWAHSGEQEAVVERFQAALREQNDAAFDAARSTFGALSTAREIASRGLQARWSTHWAAWAASRTLPASHGDDAEPYTLLLKRHVHMDRAKAAFQQATAGHDLPDLGPWTLPDWLVWIASKDLNHPHLPTAELLMSFDRNGLPGAYEAIARDFLRHPALHDLAHTLKRLDWIRGAMSQPAIGVVAEVPFGEDAPPVQLHREEGSEPVQIGPITLDLHSRTVRTRGIIDRVLLVGRPQDPLLRITDYKSGGFAPTTKAGLDKLLKLQEPQLVVYALVLREALRSGLLPESFTNGTVTTVGWDHLRATTRAGEALKLKRPMDRFLLDDATLDLLARALGSLVGRAQAGDWLLSPRSDTCPKTRSWGHDHCPFADACRFRAPHVQGAP